MCTSSAWVTLIASLNYFLVLCFRISKEYKLRSLKLTAQNFKCPREGQELVKQTLQRSFNSTFCG